jgi:hypothetical protein
MSKSLLIVESLTKARTLERYLGKDFIVKAGVGHVKDLPGNKLGIDFDAGTRSFSNDAVVREAIKVSGFRITEIVSGGSKGVDESAERIAAEKAISLRRFPANWREFGRSAGPRRNLEMSIYADALIAIWDGKSPETQHMIEAMKKAGKPVYVHMV